MDMDKRKKRRPRNESNIRLEHQKRESKLWYEEARSHAKAINLETALCAYNKKTRHDHLDVTREAELINQFLRVNEDLEQGEEKVADLGPPMLPPDVALEQKQLVVKFSGEDVDQPKKRSSVDQKGKGVTVAGGATRSGQAKTSAGKHIEHEAKKRTVQKRQRRRRVASLLRGEELYTDKDRAAAVNMGTKDIKRSLKEKRQADRTSAMRIPAEAEPGTFLALGNYEMNRGDVRIARDFIDKALELNGNEKNALVARSRCYVLLGQPEKGLKDAEAALERDKTFFKAIYQKAESLYYLGDFEHSLMFYHRGHKLRPDHVGFKLGIQKSQKAIENVIGGPIFNNHPSKSTPFYSNARDSVVMCNIPTTRTSTTNTTKPCDFSDVSTTDAKATIRNSAASSNRTTVIIATKDGNVTKNGSCGNNGKKSRSLKSGGKVRLLRELSADKQYLDSLLNNPNLKCMNKEEDATIINSIKETIDYLNSRQEFWRQQLPPNLK